MFIPFVIDLPIPFDVLDAAVYEFLPGRALGWIEFSREATTHGSVIFKLQQEQLGDIGKIKLRKKTDLISELYVTHSPKPTDKELLEYEKLTKPSVREKVSQISQGANDHPGYLVRAIFLYEVIESEDIVIELERTEDSLAGIVLNVSWPVEFSREMRREKFSQAEKRREASREKLHDKRKEHLGKVVNVLFERLEQDDIFVTSKQEIKTLVILAKKLERYFDESELKDLFFQLSEDYENLLGTTKQEKVRELVKYLDRRERIEELLELCHQMRPKVRWNVNPKVRSD